MNYAPTYGDRVRNKYTGRPATILREGQAHKSGRVVVVRYDGDPVDRAGFLAAFKKI